MCSGTVQLGRVVLLFLCATCCLCATEIPDGLRADRTALIALQQAVSANGFGLSRLASWKALGNPCWPRPWSHVTCGGGRVVGLTLSNLKIQGTLPPALKLATSLVTLNLEGNKFSGTIPDEWADNAYFSSLETLNLQNNNLRGLLPNRRWNRLNAFPRLRTFDISGNGFYGGLPDGWLGSARVFKRLEYLDLSANYLGYLNAGRTQLSTSYSPTGVSGTDYWCLQGVAVGTVYTGWCAHNAGTLASPLSGTMAALRFLDISDNGLKGFMPPNWGKIFTKLNYFLIHDNQMYPTADNVPDVLPSEWTRRTAPRTFPNLQALVLYPGNDYACFLPNDDPTSSKPYQDVNADSSYQILDASDEPYDFTNPWLCPGPDTETAPTSVTIGESASQKIRVTFVGIKNSATQMTVFGYKITIYLQSTDPEIWDALDNWNGKLYRIYGESGTLPVTYSTDLVESSLDSSTSTYTLTTSYGSSELAGTYKAEVVALYLDGFESSVAESSGVEIDFLP